MEWKIKKINLIKNIVAHIKKINLYTTGENEGFVKTFRSLNECAKYLRISNLTISNALTGRFVSKQLNGYRVEYSGEIKRAVDSKPKGEPVFIEKVKGNYARKIEFIKEILSLYYGTRIAKSAFAEHLWCADELKIAQLLYIIKQRKGCDAYNVMLEFFGKK